MSADHSYDFVSMKALSIRLASSRSRSAGYTSFLTRSSRPFPSGKFLDSPYTTLTMPKFTTAPAHMSQGMSVDYIAIPLKLLSLWRAFSRQLVSPCMMQAPSCRRRLRPLANTVPRAFSRTAPMGMPLSRAPVRAS